MVGKHADALPGGMCAIRPKRTLPTLLQFALAPFETFRAPPIRIHSLLGR